MEYFINVPKSKFQEMVEVTRCEWLKQKQKLYQNLVKNKTNHITKCDNNFITKCGTHLERQEAS